MTVLCRCCAGAVTVQAAHGIAIGDNTAGVKTNKNYAENVLLPPILKNTNDAGTVRHGLDWGVAPL